jgi:hypothetical protein
MHFWKTFKNIASHVPGTVKFYHFLHRLFGSKKAVLTSLHRGLLPEIDQICLKEKYLQSSVSDEADTFVLYRILGNDLVPRHKKGQTRENLRFILENESEFSGCEKRFVVNRIVDTEEEKLIIRMLEKAGMKYIHIPFFQDDYLDAGWDIEGVPGEFAPCAPGFKILGPDSQGRISMRMNRFKNNYVMNNNGARNAALTQGKKLAKWVLPWDGNCFIAQGAWKEIVTAVQAAPEFPYFVVPMARITDNPLLLDSDYRPLAGEEPQLLFRKDSFLSFNDSFFYGRRPKVELLWRIGVPGNWDQWKLEPWDLPGPVYAAEAGAFAHAGWVARLNSGQQQLEKDSDLSKVNRGLARVEAVSGLLDQLDSQKRVSGTEGVNTGKKIPVVRSSLIEKLQAEGEKALLRGPYSVLDKTTLAPSGDPHDYWHPAPYFWPNRLTPSGRPYVKRDGQRVPGTRLYEPLAEQYDRTCLQRLFDDTRILALAWQHTGEKRYAEHGARMVCHWFLDPDSAMNPHLNYAQVRLGHNKNMGYCSGIIEMKDLYFFLDAVRMLVGAGAISSEEHTCLQEWFEQYLHWLRTSSQGQKERTEQNNHGLYYDLQVASIALFTGNRLLVRDTLRDSRFRLLQHFDARGRQTEEMKRTTTAHYCCFNLQGWIHLAQLAEQVHEDLWGFEGKDGQGLKKGMWWFLKHLGRDWPYPQIDAFDDERFYPIYYICKSKYGLPPELDMLDISDAKTIKPLFYPHDGIRPFWQLY